MRKLSAVHGIAAFAVLAVLVAFGVGLTGPWVLDDHVNTAAIWDWLYGARSFQLTLLDNGSGPLGRPLAYATFMANAVLGGNSPLGFKLTNLLLHLLTGALLALLLREVLDRIGVAAGTLTAVVLALVWAVHPLQVSTVLYVVQRMTILASLFTVAALLVYLHGRRLLASDRRTGQAFLFVAFPGFVVAGLLAKETAALTPGFAFLLELVLFRGTRRPPDIRAFFAAFLVLPLAVGLIYFLTIIDDLPARYARREFSLAERLMTQPRVLGNYLATLALPTEARLGLYRDGYPHSTGLLAPWSTLAWILAWGAAALAGWLARRRMPLVFLGLSWFLWGHALEASFIPLEPYFEHRNYLPSLGFWLALYGLAMPLGPRIGARALLTAALALALVLATLTAVRAWHWASLDRLLATEGPPGGETSRRLQVDRAIRAFEVGDTASEAEALDRLQATGPANHAAASVWRATFACDRDRAVPAAAREQLLRSAPPVVTHSHVSYLMVLARRVDRGICTGLTRVDLADVAGRWIEHSTKPIPPTRLRQLETLIAWRP